MMWKGHAIHADPPEAGTLPVVNREGALETPPILMNRMWLKH